MSGFKIAKTYWVWTEIAEGRYADRKDGTPIWEMYRQTVPTSWVDKGYVREADGE